MSTYRNTRIVSACIAATVMALGSAAAFADEPGATSRDQRMDAALENYRAGHATGRTTANDPVHTTGPSGAMEPRCDDVAANDSALSRAEAAMKRGACKTGRAIDRGVHKAGDAVGRAGHKAGDALRRTGEKIGGSSDKSDTSKSDPQAR